MIAIRHAWLQKHPSPSAAGGEFHWHPPDRDRDLRASIVERMRGIEPPAVLWQLARGRVAWAQLFAAVAPTDHRNYVGVVLTIAEEDGAPPARLLDAIVPPGARPWTETAGPDADSKKWSDGDAPALARSLLSGGPISLADPTSPRLPSQLATFERWLPDSVIDRVREGACVTKRVPRVSDPVAELLVAATRTPGSRADQAWKLLVELARTRTIDDVAALAMPAAATAFVDTLHTWGRDAADTTPTHLADTLALRVLARLMRGEPGDAAIAEARWYALLPARRRSALLDALVARAPSLRMLVERHRA